MKVKNLIMGVVRNFLPLVIVAAVSIALLLYFMMWEFDMNGLSYLAVVLGFSAVGVLQIFCIYIGDKIREMPEPVKYW